jgi:hypothetical protein
MLSAGRLSLGVYSAKEQGVTNLILCFVVHDKCLSERII